MVSGRGLILRCYSNIRLEGLKETKKNLNNYSLSPESRIDPWTPEYETLDHNVRLRVRGQIEVPISVFASGQCERYEEPQSW
jgi:hypothetical protein